MDEAADVGGGGVAGGVDDEAGVLGGNLGAADLEAFEAGLLDQGAGEVAFGALEGAAGAGHLEGLLALAALGEVVHLGADGFAVAGLEAKLDFDDGLAVVLEAAVAVAEVEFVATIGVDVAFAVDGAHGVGDVLHLAVVGAGVHEDGAADAAGDAAGEFEAGQAALRGGFGDVFEEGAGAGDDARALMADLGHRAREFHDDAADALVLHEDVGAVAEDGQRQLVLVDEGEDLLGLLHGGGEDQAVGGSADLEGRVEFHRLIEAEAVRLDEGLAFLDKAFVNHQSSFPSVLWSSLWSSRRLDARRVSGGPCGGRGRLLRGSGSPSAAWPRRPRRRRSWRGSASVPRRSSGCARSDPSSP